MEHLHGSDFHGAGWYGPRTKSVEFIKSNISTAQDISQIAGAIDGLFDGQKQINQKRFLTTTLLGNIRVLRTMLSMQNWRRNNSTKWRY